MFISRQGHIFSKESSYFFNIVDHDGEIISNVLTGIVARRFQKQSDMSCISHLTADFDDNRILALLFGIRRQRPTKIHIFILYFNQRRIISGCYRKVHLHIRCRTPRRPNRRIKTQRFSCIRLTVTITAIQRIHIFDGHQIQFGWTGCNPVGRIEIDIVCAGM